jgi:flavin-dependent dehydrogenase
MTTNPDVLIIGGGLAGLAGALHLSKQGLSVTLIEKTAYPKHKVCGEYISNEILPYLDWLGVDVSQLHPAAIKAFEFSSVSGGVLSARLPLGGFGVSRYALDHYMYEIAQAGGCTIIEGAVTDVTFHDDEFSVIASDRKYKSKIVLGAFGKRSAIDQLMARDFIKKRSPWLAVKAHYSGLFPDDLVALHNFEGGYCGVSRVEGDAINICYLADYDTFKQYKNIAHYQAAVLYKNKHLKNIFENSTMLFDKPLTISQVSFEKKEPVENHVLMMGDTAGLIHPLCGNGMAMAIHSAKIASELVISYHAGKLNRVQMESGYRSAWDKTFSSRLNTGRMLGRALENKFATRQLLGILNLFPSLLPHIIKRTHGKPVTIQ